MTCRHIPTRHHRIARRAVDRRCGDHLCDRYAVNDTVNTPSALEASYAIIDRHAAAGTAGRPLDTTETSRWRCRARTQPVDSRPTTRTHEHATVRDVLDAAGLGLLVCAG